MKRKGFTLVELLAVIAILALLVIIALPNVLKIFNQAKKDTFLTEAKTIYKEISKKYISETMRGNKVDNISNSNNKLDVETNDLKYNIKLDSMGNIESFQVSNDIYCLNGKFNNLSELTIDKITNGKCEAIVLEPDNFTTDSWETIISAVRKNNTNKYHVGDTKEIDLGEYGTHNLRISNMSSPSECETTNFSQSACGFVLEFEDIIAIRNMNSTAANKGGWPETNMRAFLNSDIYNLLPDEIKSGIIDTKVISGHGGTKGEINFSSIDKLYLFSTAEIWKQGSTGLITSDTAMDVTRQLDYYKNLGVTTDNCAGAIKKYGNASGIWWLRSALSKYIYYFYFVGKTGHWGDNNVDFKPGFSPAFRIG